MNVSKFLLGGLALSLAYLAWQVHSQAGLIAEHGKQLQALIARDQGRGVISTLDTQERCAKQAALAFRQLGWDKNPLAGFANHFNGALGRCFMQIESSSQVGATGWNNKTLLDAVEGRVLGSYVWHSDPVKKYWEVPPVTCEMNLPTGDKATCKSADEFDELAKNYMH